VSHSSSQAFLSELDKKLWTAACKLPVHTGGLKESERLAHLYKITSTGKLIDDALEAVEKENPKLKNVLNKNYTQLQIDPANFEGAHRPHRHHPVPAPGPARSDRMIGIPEIKHLAARPGGFPPFSA
jgi:hypothetical protein